MCVDCDRENHCDVQHHHHHRVDGTHYARGEWNGVVDERFVAKRRECLAESMFARWHWHGLIVCVCVCVYTCVSWRLVAKKCASLIKRWRQQRSTWLVATTMATRSLHSSSVALNTCVCLLLSVCFHHRSLLFSLGVTVSGWRATCVGSQCGAGRGRRRGAWLRASSTVGTWRRARCRHSAASFLRSRHRAHSAVDRVVARPLHGCCLGPYHTINTRSIRIESTKNTRFLACWRTKSNNKLKKPLSKSKLFYFHWSWWSYYWIINNIIFKNLLI